MTLIKTLAASLLAIAFAGSAWADSTVKVALWDHGAAMDMSAHMGLGMHAKMAMAMMGVTTDVSTVPAGKVTFEVTNSSKEVIHEMIVSSIKDVDTQLPYLADQNRVDEDNIGDRGEVSELDPGKSGALTITLEPGLYLLFCNVPGHFISGMWTTITVK
jgi:uncharacterized cupredoxin-like copper-binding protein